MLVLCPSWLKAEEVHRRCLKIIGGRKRIRAQVIYGGGAEEEQILPLIQGCELLAATPACFLRMLKKSYTTLDRLCHIVFDDADVLVEEFTTEVKEIMRRYAKLLKSQPGRSAPRQAVAMATSWTVGVESLVRAYLGNPLLIMSDRIEAAMFGRVRQIVKLCSVSQRETHLLGKASLCRIFSVMFCF